MKRRAMLELINELAIVLCVSSLRGRFVKGQSVSCPVDIVASKNSYERLVSIT